ncbi:exported hypothetical protein [Gammaproteobacteria bacterium]
MIKILLALACFACAFTNFTTPNSFTDASIITATPFNQNFDSLAAALNRNKDTTENKFIRFTDLTSGDTTLSLLKADTIAVTNGIRGRVTGNVVGSVTGNVTGNCSGTAATVTGAAQSAITSVGTLTGLTSSGTVIVDSLKSTKQVEANLKGNVTGDLTGNCSGTAATVTGAAQASITSVGALTGLTTTGSVGVGGSAVEALHVVDGKMLISDKSYSFPVFSETFLNSVTGTSGTATLCSLSVSADVRFFVIEVTAFGSRAPATDIGTSQVAKKTFSVARNGSGSNVVLDSIIGAGEYSITTTTAGGTKNELPLNLTIQRSGAEANSAAQGVRIVCGVGTNPTYASFVRAVIRVLSFTHVH